MNDLTEKELERLLNEKRQTKTKKRFSSLIVTSIVVLNALFTIAVLYLFLQTQSEPVTLIGAWFAFTTVELWSLAKIKRDKIKKEIEEIE